MQDLFYIKLDQQNIRVREYDKEDLEADLQDESAKSYKDLIDYDFKIFNSEKKAENYKDKYMKVLNTLDNSKMCLSRDLPCMLYKRRYLVQTILGDKNQTIRSYKKDWKKGQKFNFFDQTYFLTVELISLKKLSDSLYVYKFKRSL